MAKREKFERSWRKFVIEVLLNWMIEKSETTNFSRMKKEKRFFNRINRSESPS